MALFEKGRELLLSEGGWRSTTINSETGAKFKAIACDMDDAGPSLNNWKVSNCTNSGTTVTITLPTGHGFSAGHIIEVFLVGGITNVNGVWTVTSVTATTVVFTVTTTPTGTYTSGGYVANLSLQFLSEFIPSGGRISTSAAMTGLTNTNGVADANDEVFTNVSGDTIEAILIVRSAVYFGDADLADTSQRLIHLITPSTSGTVGLPVTPNTANINLTWNAQGIFKI